VDNFRIHTPKSEEKRGKSVILKGLKKQKENKSILQTTLNYFTRNENMFDANVPEKNKPFFNKHMIFQLSQISNHVNKNKRKKKRESKSEPKVNKKSKFKLTLHEKQEQKKMAKYAFIHYTTQKLYKKDEEALHLKDHGLETKNPSSFNFASVSKYLVKPDEEEPLHIPKFC